MADDKPIIVIKKKGHHGGHHGGAWKVAYADFVTAMMAFFMVMWLVNAATTPVKKSIASYFRKPGIFETGSGTPLQIGGSGFMTDTSPPKPEEKKKGSGTSAVQLKSKGGQTDSEFKGRGDESTGKFDQAQGPRQGMFERPVLTSNEPPDEKVEKLFEEGMAPGADSSTTEGKEKAGLTQSGKQSTGEPNTSALDKQNVETQQELQKHIRQVQEELLSSPEIKKISDQLEVRVDADGLTIEIMDTARAGMFAPGRSIILGEAREAFAKIGLVLGRLPNKIDVIGHTDAKVFFEGSSRLSNWDLSSMRANEARRVLVESGVPEEHFQNVIGRADRDPRRPENPLDPANRRITLKVRMKVEKPPSLQDTQPLRPAGNKPPEDKPLTPAEAVERTKRAEKIFLPGEEPGKRKDASHDRIFGDAPIIPKNDLFTNY